ncbi:MAG: hypothetical protein AABP62_07620 [Planctomycetota bacterium]
MRPDALIGIVAGISFVYVGLVLFVAYIARRLESKLIVMGLLTAAASVAYGSLVGGPGMQVASQGMSPQMGQMGMSTQLSSGSQAEMLMRLGVILVLAGLGVACSTRCCPPAPESGGAQL